VTSRHYSGRWQAFSRRARNVWIRHLGYTCAGWQRTAHPSTDLTTDHIDPRHLEQGVTILCRRCNSARGDLPWTEPLITIAMVGDVPLKIPDRTNAMRTIDTGGGSKVQRI